MKVRQIILLFVLFFPAILFSQSWEPDFRLTTADSCAKIWGGSQWPIAIGMDSTVHIVWEDRRDGWPKEVYYNHSSDNGNSWETDVPLTANSEFFQNAPCIVADRQNRLHVVYTEEVYNGGVPYPEVHYKRSRYGGNSWDSQITIAYLTGYAMHWSLATDLQDGVYVVHTDQTGGWYDDIDIFVKYSTNSGNNWYSEKLSTSQQTLCGSVAADTLGKVHVVWLDNGTGNWQIMYRRSLDMGQNWEPAQTLTAEPSLKASPTIYTDRENTIHLVWADNRDGMMGIYYIQSTDGGESWGSEKKLTSTGISTWTHPNITCDLIGNVYVTWKDTLGSLDGIGFKKSTDGGNTWGQDTMVTSADTINYCPAITSSDNGDYLHLLWNDKRTGCHEIYYKRRVSGVWVQRGKVSDKRNRAHLNIMQNPASHNVFLKVSPPSKTKISVKIFDLSGRMIVELVNGLTKPSTLLWNCKDQSGHPVPSGIYVVRLQGASEPLQKKIVIIK
jgi:hypothetical protein